MIVEIERQVAAEVSDWVPSVAELTLWVETVAEFSQRPLWLTIRMVGATESQQLNQTYRGKNKPTNVLSFAFEPPPGYPADEPYIGDLVLCVDVVAMESETQHKIPAHHWAHLVIHGTLHLLGYDHEVPAAAADMEAIETALLSQLNITNPYETV
jgi:probable rRNA maturation factor